MGVIEELMSCPQYKAVLEAMDAAGGAVSGKCFFEVEGVPMLGVVVTVGEKACTAVRDAVSKLEEAKFETSGLLFATDLTGVDASAPQPKNRVKKYG